MPRSGYSTFLRTAAVVFVVTAPMQAQQRSAPAPFEGAWRHVSLTVTASDTTAVTTFTEPSVYLFTAGHYSWFAYTRPDRPKGPLTNADKIAMFDAFFAAAGRYTVRDSTATLEAVAAKNPSNVGMRRTFTFRVRGDTAVWTEQGRSPKDTTKTAQVRTTMVRLR